MITETYRIWKQEEYSYKCAFGFLPKITAYLHEGRERRPCILIVPGGAYGAVSPTEGELVARRFWKMGYQAFVLTYTTNLLQIEPLKLQPLKDISRAVRYIRRFVDKFNIEEDRLVVCGFSAGGHLCGSLCVHYEDIADMAEEYAGISNRPNAAVLCYPVITTGEMAHKESFLYLLGKDATKEELEYMSLEKHVSEQVPPVFLWATATDEGVPVENSELFAKACREKGVICAFHMFSEGKHGLSLADEDWANRRYMDTYTLEQVINVFGRIKEGTVSVPKETLAGFEMGMMQQAGVQKEIPNREVSIWPDMADVFLKNVLGIYSKDNMI